MKMGKMQCLCENKCEYETVGAHENMINFKDWKDNVLRWCKVSSIQDVIDWMLYCCLHKCLDFEDRNC